MRKRNSFIFFIFFLSASLFGQIQRFSLSINGGGSYTLINNKIPECISKGKIGYNTDLQFNFALTHTLGVATGIGYAKYSSALSLDNYYSANPATDSEGDSYEYRLYGKNLKENQTIDVIEIPFLLIFQNQERKKFKTYLQLGVKTLLPMRSRFECTSGDIESRGYYSKYNVELSNLPSHGFDKISLSGLDGNILTQIGYAATIEYGANISVGKPYVKIALFGCYGISNICQSRNLLSTEFVYQSLSSVSNGVTPLSIGVKLGLMFPFESKK